MLAYQAVHLSRMAVQLGDKKITAIPNMAAHSNWLSQAGRGIPRNLTSYDTVFRYETVEAAQLGGWSIRPTTEKARTRNFLVIIQVYTITLRSQNPDFSDNLLVIFNDRYFSVFFVSSQ